MLVHESLHVCAKQKQIATIFATHNSHVIAAREGATGKSKHSTQSDNADSSSYRKFQGRAFYPNSVFICLSEVASCLPPAELPGIV